MRLAWAESTFATGLRTRPSSNRFRAALVELGEHALVDLTDDEGYSVVYFPSIQGKVTLLRLSKGEIDGLIVHDEDAPAASVARVQRALESAGLAYQASW